MSPQLDQSRFSPAAPVIETVVAHPVKKVNKVKVEMQLDSGADMTCIPLNVISRIPNLRRGSVDAVDYDGRVLPKTTRFISIKIDNQEFIIEAVEIEGEVGLLGRDLLNEYRTILDGPNLEFNMEYS